MREKQLQTSEEQRADPAIYTNGEGERRFTSICFWLRVKISNMFNGRRGESERVGDGSQERGEKNKSYTI